MSKDFTQSVWILIITTIVVASFSLLVWVVPNIVRTADIAEGSMAKPLTALELAGRDIYISEGCHVCHTQMVRPLDPEVKRNGRANQEADDIYEFQIFGVQNAPAGSHKPREKILRSMARYSSYRPRQVVPTSIMPPYPWLFEQTLSGDDIGDKMTTLRTLGVPYTDSEISEARLQVRGKTKAEALIRYLQSLGQDTAQEASP